MAYTALVGLGSQIGVGITSVKLYQCGNNCTSCTPITNYTNVAVSSFNSPGLSVTGITDGTTCIKAEPVGVCSGSTQCIIISGIPGPTPSPTVPLPTPTASSTAPAPTASTTAPAPTASATAPAPTPTPSATSLPGCSSIVSGEYTGSTLYNYDDRQLNFAGVANGSIITFTCTANNRPNNISIRTALTVLESTGWFGSSEGYSSGDYWYPTAGTGPKTLTITYDNTKTYYIDTLTAPATLLPPNDESDYWEVNISCSGPAPTPTPSSTTPPLYGFFRSNPKVLYNGHCNDNQVTSAAFYSTSSTIPLMLNTTVYTNTSYAAWVGGEFYYAVSSDNTFNTNVQPYYAIKVNDLGEVISVQYISSCTGGSQET